MNKDFTCFCNEITTIVENSILSWHGRNDIYPTQGIKLVQKGYMLGGFIIDKRSDIMPALSCFSLFNGCPRISGYELKRDDDALFQFYLNYENRFYNCKHEDELIDLTSKIAKELYDHSMNVIRQTCEFGG